jgi:hypothetical protein
VAIDNARPTDSAGLLNTAVEIKTICEDWVEYNDWENAGQHGDAKSGQ